MRLIQGAHSIPVSGPVQSFLLSILTKIFELKKNFEIDAFQIGVLIDRHQSNIIIEISILTRGKASTNLEFSPDFWIDALTLLMALCAPKVEAIKQDPKRDCRE
jgi:hypothetical protein